MSQSNILAILASPHSNGITVRMLDYTIDSLKKKGHLVFKINLYSKKTAYCKGCRTCLDTEICVIKDDMIEITHLLKKADIVAAPVY